MTDVVSAVSWIDASVRLIVAVALGGVVGVNRELRGKPAGLRTHALVALGAALVVLVIDGLAPGPEPQSSSRAIQGIITGIGFLGAGVILRPSGETSVRGLTTAATIWIAAGLGTACGNGFWLIASIATGLTVAVLVLGDVVEQWIHRGVFRTGRGGSDV